MDKNKLSPYIRHAGYSTITAPFVINKRVIFDYEIIFIKDGMCRIRIDENDYICKKNNIVFLRPGINHSFHSVENIDFVQPHIHFDAIYSEKSTVTPISFKPRETMTNEEKLLIQDDIFKNINIPSVFYASDSSEFQKLFFKIIDSYSSGRYSDLKIKADMLKLLDLLLTQFEEPNTASVKMNERITESIKNYIDENYSNILTLNMLSDLFFINKFTLMRKFKNMYGINIIRYYNSKRIEAASNMLINTNMTVKAIGEALNFTDAYSFSRFFKTATGTAPLEFRKKNNFFK